jgi:predicted acyl esterase
MIIEWDVPIEMDDGLQLRADIFRPIGPRQARHGPTPRKRQLRHGRRQGRLPEAIDARHADDRDALALQQAARGIDERSAVIGD